MTEWNQDLAIWQKVKAAVDEALERPSAERSGLLESLCEEPDLLDRALAVLEVFESVADDASIPSPEAPDDASAPPSPSVNQATATAAVGPGSEVGPYRIERKLGTGGMGAVYLAGRSDRAFDKKVAIKLIKQKWAISEAQISRFRRERQILANLTHPAIAQLLDGGSTPQGYPYLVMEYVEGEAIDAYCASRTLSVDEILDLFEQICGAVQFAHQNLIVHRDLKPANILVGSDGKVKLLDFGIAKILDARDFGVTVLETRTGSSPMTLAYASPEQVSGGVITTATDVYSLGILLFQLLTGQRPHPFDSRNLPEAVDAICHQEVPRPSETLRRHSRDSEGSRNLSSSWRRIHGDLDAIVLKALEKDPGRRYRSAEQLADDLGRFRSSLPVLARKGTTSYRAQKFVRRHRAALSAVAIVFTVLVASVLVLLQQQEELVHQRNRAETVADWMVSLFELSDPGQALGSEITVREVLDHSSSTIRKDLADDSQLLHQMLMVLGNTYFSLGLPNEAEGLITDALEIANVSGTDAEKARGLLLLARALYGQGEWQKSAAIADEVLSIGRRRSLLTDRELAEALILKGMVANSLARHVEAASTYEEARLLAEKVDDSNAVARILELSAINLFRGHRPERAQQLQKQSLEIRRELLPEQHPHVLKSELRLVAFTIEDASEWPQLIGKLDSFRKLYPENSEPIVWILRDTSKVAEELGLVEEQRALLQDAMDISTAIWGADNILKFYCMGDIAEIYQSQGDFVTASTIYQDVLAMGRRLGAEQNPATGVVLNNLAVMDIQSGRVGEAESKLRRAWNILKDVEAPLERLPVLTNLGAIATRRGNLELARDFQMRAIAEGRKAPAGAPKLIATLYNFAGTEKELGNLEEARAHFLEVWNLKATSVADSYLRPRALCRVAEVELEMGQLDAAHRRIDLCAEAWTRWEGHEQLKLFPIYLRGLWHMEKGQFREAVEVLEEVLARRRELGARESVIQVTQRALERARKGGLEALEQSE